MRFYAFNFNELDILPSQEPEGTPSKLQRDTQVVKASIAADFTRPPAASEVFNGEVLSQVSDPSHKIRRSSC